MPAKKGLFLGLTAIDLLYYLSDFPVENTKHKTKDQYIDIGGPATNAAYAFAALGGEATLLSLIGQHPFRHFMLERLNYYGIHHIDLNPFWSQYPEIASILINRNTGSRTVATRQPVEEIALSPPDIHLSDYDVLCIDGFYGEYVHQLLQQNHTGIPVVFDGGSFKAYTLALLPHISYPILSEHFSIPDQPFVEHFFTENGISPFAITNGERPIIAYENDKRYEVPVPRIEAVDTLGAGDIFHGAFAYFILENEGNFRSSLSQAAEIASRSCQVMGTRDWI